MQNLIDKLYYSKFFSKFAKALTLKSMLAIKDIIIYKDITRKLNEKIMHNGFDAHGEHLGSSPNTESCEVLCAAKSGKDRRSGVGVHR